MRHVWIAAALLCAALLLCLTASAADPGALTTEHIRYIEGMGDGLFCPDAPMTRAQSAQMLWRLLSDREHIAPNTIPRDAAAGAWYYEAVTQLVARGVILGYEDGTFRPDTQITRAEFVTLLVRLTGAAGEARSFPDTAGHWAEDSIAAATEAGWIEGYAEPDGSVTFRPDRNISRAEAVTVLNRLLGRAADPEALQQHAQLYYIDVPDTAWYYAAVMEASIAHGHAVADEGEVWTEVRADGTGFADADPIARQLSRIEALRDIPQLIVVTGHRLTAWERGSAGQWFRWLDVYCGYGKNGMGEPETRVEGNLQTPVGLYPLTMTFGTDEDPGAGLPYRQITANSYWSSVRDETYNTWVESAVPVYGEYLRDYPVQYRYALVIGFNTDPVVFGRGSGIFLHCRSADHWYTGGCVSIEEPDMLQVLRRTRPGAYILIAEDEAQLAARANT